MRLRPSAATLGHALAASRRWAGAWADVAVPAVCPACGEFAPRGAALCPACAAIVEAEQARPACGLCGKPVPGFGDACGHCRGGGLRPLAGVLRLGVLDGPLHELVVANKFRGHWWGGEQLGDLLWRRPEVRDAVEQADAVVAVPLHWRRELARGYNQAGQIARTLARRGGVPLARPAARRKPTTPQIYSRSVRQRLDNLRDAFHLVDPTPVTGRRLVLVDDVLTTGATLRSLARALLPARPAALTAIVAAVADPARPRHGVV